MWQAQLGILGFWVSNECRLADRLSLHSEVGLNGTYEYVRFLGESYSNLTFMPAAAVEPRWYYNLGRRADRGATTQYNSASYISMNIALQPSWFYFSTNSRFKPESQLFIGPMWGMRRTHGHFSYELAAGPAYSYSYFKSDGIRINESNVGIRISARVGLSLGK